MKELLSNYSSVYKRRDDFFVYKGQSIMGLILEVDRIGLSHGPWALEVGYLARGLRIFQA